MNQAASESIKGDVSPPPQDSKEPRSIGFGHPEYHFVAAIMELKTTIHKMDTDQKVSMAKVEVKLDSVKETIETAKGKLSGIESDVLEFKQIRHTAKVVGWIVGLTCTVLLAIAGFIAKEVWSIVKPPAVGAINPPATIVQAQPSVSQKPVKK
jgi:hypothetical protein